MASEAIFKKMIRTNFSLLLVIIAISGSSCELAAQSPEEDYRRFSASVHGGITLPTENGGIHFFASNFNVLTEQTYNIGFGGQYAITPFWSLGMEYRFTTIEGRGGSFVTDLHSVGLKNYFNFNRLYRSLRLSEYVNPFVTLTIGRDFFAHVADGQRTSANGLNGGFGFGLAGNISETIEIFGQYDLQFGSNSLDNRRQGFPLDLLGMASGGVRIYFGSNGTRRYSMAPPSVRL
jgi:hypothetical protein